MIKIDSFKIWGELITVTKIVSVLTLNYYDEKWLCIEAGAGCNSRDMEEIYQHCIGVGDKIYFINNNLYFDSTAFFNIDLMFNNYDFITI